MEMLPEVWGDETLRRHYAVCESTRSVQVRNGCGDVCFVLTHCECGEPERHTPHAVARAEVDLLTTSVS